jgi:hypothetical protein
MLMEKTIRELAVLVATVRITAVGIEPEQEAQPVRITLPDHLYKPMMHIALKRDGLHVIV